MMSVNKMRNSIYQATALYYSMNEIDLFGEFIIIGRMSGR